MEEQTGASIPFLSAVYIYVAYGYGINLTYICMIPQRDYFVTYSPGDSESESLPTRKDD